MRRSHGLAKYKRDKRDLVHVPGDADPARAKKHVDLSAWWEMPEVWDQEPDMESCAVHAAAAAWEFAARKSGHEAGTPSRLFIWYEGCLLGDGGTGNTAITLRSALHVLKTQGAPPEECWPYDTKKVGCKPPPEVYEAAAEHKVAQYYFGVRPRAEQSLVDALKILLAEGFPICFGFQYFAGFETEEVERTGEVPLPRQGQEALGDGHAALLVGYDDCTRRFKARNSFGAGWGEKGYFTLPYDYVSPAFIGPELWVVKREGPSAHAQPH